MSWVKAAHDYGNRNREEEKNLAEIKTAHKDEEKKKRCAARGSRRTERSCL